MYETGQYLIMTTEADASATVLDAAVEDARLGVILPRSYGVAAYLLDPDGSQKIDGLRFCRLGGFDYPTQAELACRKAGSRLVIRVCEPDED